MHPWSKNDCRRETPPATDGGIIIFATGATFELSGRNKNAACLSHSVLMEAGEETRPVLTGRFRADLAPAVIDCENGPMAACYGSCGA